ncbi:MAG: hypothetical protein D6733_03510 [Methanobacteriota archaeon]|nr:MAG: hypothetical protein D6733_03510 [Euryarchaeota archaeon]
MKLALVIPTYWSRERGVGWKPGDAVYDHPTPLDDEGTLGRAIESLAVLEEDFTLAVIAVPTSKDIEADVEVKVRRIARSASHAIDKDVLVFGPSNLEQTHDILLGARKKGYGDLLQLNGYSNVRNLCLFIPHVLGSDVAVLIDDDEVVEDPLFLSKAREFIGKETGGRPIHGVGGYYLQPEGGYHVKKPFRPWMRHWDKTERMNEAFDRFIGKGPRLKETPFVFGGCMIIHRELYRKVPFDPGISRGEDIDYLINTRIFGGTFYLDNRLSVRHMPPPKTHPTWMRIREDIYRFIYERAKLKGQTRTPRTTIVRPEDLDPYPGCFLKTDLETKIEKACRLLSQEYLEAGDKEGSQETLKNIEIARREAVPRHNPFQHLLELQKRWESLMDYTAAKETRAELEKTLHHP